MVPLSAEVYFASLADYSLSIWPRQLVFGCLGVMMIILAARPKPAGRICAIILFIAWAHVGFAYHLNYFAELNFWDVPIGVLFLVQSVIVLWYGAVQNCFPSDRSNLLAVIAMMIALVMPPLLGLSIGRPVAQVQLFGISPGPTVLFMGGYLCAARGWLRVFWPIPLLLLIPIIVLASALNITEDFVVLILPAFLLLSVVLRASKQ